MVTETTCYKLLNVNWFHYKQTKASDVYLTSAFASGSIFML